MGKFNTEDILGEVDVMDYVVASSLLRKNSWYKAIGLNYLVANGNFLSVSQS